MLFRGVLIAAISVSLLGQVPVGHYEALKQALGLSDSQLQQLQERQAWQVQQWRSDWQGFRESARPAGRLNRLIYGDRTDVRRLMNPGLIDDSFMNQLLDDSQRAKLAEVEKVLQRRDMASQTIVLGLISAEHWPGGPLCHPWLYAYGSELWPSSSQARQLYQLQLEAREPFYAQVIEKEYYRSWLLSSGISADSPVVVHFLSAIAELRRQAARTRSPRERVLAVLDDVQKAKLAEFETACQLAIEAIELGLLPETRGGEVICP